MPVIGEKLVIKNLISFGSNFTKKVNKTMGSVATIVDKRVKENLSGGLTPSDLSGLDHPYAKRHGERGKQVLTPWYKVNKQTGRLLNSKEKGIIPAQVRVGKLMATAFVKLDTDVAPHAVHVVYGTSRMIPRPVLQGSRDEVLPAVGLLMKKNLINAVLST